jgi:hypothetical protein
MWRVFHPKFNRGAALSVFIFFDSYLNTTRDFFNYLCKLLTLSAPGDYEEVSADSRALTLVWIKYFDAGPKK